MKNQEGRLTSFRTVISHINYLINLVQVSYYWHTYGSKNTGEMSCSKDDALPHLILTLLLSRLPPASLSLGRGSIDVPNMLKYLTSLQLLWPPAKRNFSDLCEQQSIGIRTVFKKIRMRLCVHATCVQVPRDGTRCPGDGVTSS